MTVQSLGQKKMSSNPKINLRVLIGRVRSKHTKHAVFYDPSNPMGFRMQSLSKTNQEDVYDERFICVADKFSSIDGIADAVAKKIEFFSNV